MNATPAFDPDAYVRDPEVDCMCDACLTAEAEALCRAFAQVYPTPQVMRGVALCEAGTLLWADVAAVFARSAAAAMKEA